MNSGVLALLVAVAFQAASAQFCGCAPPPVPSCLPPPPAPCPPPVEVGCCPGPVIEKKTIVNKAVTVPYSYSVPTYSKKCCQQPAGVDRKVIPTCFETAPVCETTQTLVKVPTTDIEVNQQPLCRKTCTTSEYLIQIPIVETTCSNTPLCKKTVKTQDNLLTTCAKRTTCAKQLCTQNQIVDTPLTSTVCQDYQGSVCKTGAKTVIKPEIKKSCVQLPPYKCLKPAGASVVDASYAPAYPSVGAYDASAYAAAYAPAAYAPAAFAPAALAGAYDASAYPGAYASYAPVADATYAAAAPCSCSCN